MEMLPLQSLAHSNGQAALSAHTHTPQQPITRPLRSGPSGFGTLLHQWDERRGGEVCVLDTAYLGFDMYISETEACLSNQLKSKAVIYYFRFKAWQRV